MTSRFRLQRLAYGCGGILALMGNGPRRYGDLVSRGNTSDVWQWSPTTVVKPLRPNMPSRRAHIEAEELGSETFVFLEIDHLGEPTRLRVRVDAERAVARGERMHVDILGPVHVFGPDGLRVKAMAEIEA